MQEEANEGEHYKTKYVRIRHTFTVQVDNPHTIRYVRCKGMSNSNVFGFVMLTFICFLQRQQ